MGGDLASWPEDDGSARPRLGRWTSTGGDVQNWTGVATPLSSTSSDCWDEHEEQLKDSPDPRTKMRALAGADNVPPDRRIAPESKSDTSDHFLFCPSA